MTKGRRPVQRTGSVGPMEDVEIERACQHPDGGYRFVPGISPYSAGVMADTDHAIRRITVRSPVPWQEGFDLIDQVLADAGRPARSLCSIELRCHRPHSFGGFGSFNDQYREALDERGVLLEGGENPVARTNVAPATDPGAETELHAFGFTIEDERGERPSFIISGAGDLRDQADLRPEAIVGAGRTWEASNVDRTTAVLDEIQGRLNGMDLSWTDTDAVVVYSAESIHAVLEPVLLARLGRAARRGIQWYLARPPIEGLLFEMDARGGVQEGWI